MTRYERRAIAACLGVEAPRRGPGKHSQVNEAVRLFGDSQDPGNHDAKKNSLGNGNGNILSEGVVYSRAIRPIRRNDYEGRPGKPNRALGGR